MRTVPGSEIVESTELRRGEHKKKEKKRRKKSKTGGSWGDEKRRSL